MSIRFSVVAIGLFVLFYINGGDRTAGAQQDAGNQGGQPLMTPLNGPANTQLTGPQKSLLVDRMDLKAYEAAMGDLSSCRDNHSCIEDAEDIKALRCVVGVCYGKYKNKEPITCFGKFSKGKSVDDLNRINASICPLVKSPGPDTRKAFLNSIGQSSSTTEGDVVEFGAYGIALRGSAKSCEKYIKDYLGAYGPRWNHHWYRALSGCRIFAGENTRAEEEKDFYTWFGVVQGSGKCSDIVNSELRNACSAPGAGSPLPGNVH